MNEEKKDISVLESDEYERFVESLQRKIDKHEKSIEKQTKIEKKIESDKETYTEFIEYINEMWETELKSITYSKLDKPQRKEYRFFKKKWKELQCDLNWYDREIKYCTNNFLETLGQKKHFRWEKHQISNNMGFVFEDNYGVVETPHQCQIPTEYQSCLFELIQLFSLFAIKLTEATDLCLDVKHFFKLETEASKRFEVFAKLKRNKNNKENYKPLQQIECAVIMYKHVKKYAAERMDFLKKNDHIKYMIPKNSFLPTIKSLERKFQRWEATSAGNNGPKPPPHYSRNKTVDEFDDWAQLYEQRRYLAWQARLITKANYRYRNHNSKKERIEKT